VNFLRTQFSAPINQPTTNSLSTLESISFNATGFTNKVDSNSNINIINNNNSVSNINNNNNNNNNQSPPMAGADSALKFFKNEIARMHRRTRNLTRAGLPFVGDVLANGGFP
jgi:hypothetical protein